MSRTSDVMGNIKKMQGKLSLNKEAERKIFEIGVITDISESLAMLVDLYALTHGVQMTDGRQQDAPEQ